MLSNTKKFKAGLAALAAVAGLAFSMPAAASANASASCNASGGVTPEEVNVCAPTPKARLLHDGMLIAPEAAPPRVKEVIAAANRIRTKPYIWGGGHGRWWDRGYDCSGSVSYALHGGDFLSSPLPSGPLEHWGAPGLGRWITVWTNAGHAYAEIAGFRWDTAGDASGTGPRWHAELLNNVGFIARHPPGY